MTQEVPTRPRPKVSVIVPCRNEARFIGPFLDSLAAQKDVEIEALIADGRSTDGAREILEARSAADPRLRLIDNPEQIVPTGLNRAIRAASCDVIVRMDVHTRYAPDYVKQCVDVLHESGADCVGGPWRAEGKSYLQKAIALAFASPFSSGGAGCHDINLEGEVDSVYLGCWRKQTLLDVGLFDEELVRNQDDELSLRLARSGRRLWQSPRIQSAYSPRSSLAALFKQYSQYGYWKIRVIQKHRLPASIRHLVPGAFVALLLGSAAVAPFHFGARLLLAALIASYVIANALATALTCRNKENRQFILVLPLVFAAYHFGFGYGSLRGAIDFLLLRRTPSGAFTRLTRDTVPVAGASV